MNRGYDLFTRKWIVATEKGRFFAKEFFAPYGPAAVESAADLNERAALSGVPVAELLQTLDGRLLYCEQQTCITLSRYVEHAKPSAILSPGQSRTAGAELGRLHRIFRDVPAGGAPLHPE